MIEQAREGNVIFNCITHGIMRTKVIMIDKECQIKTTKLQHYRSALICYSRKKGTAYHIKSMCMYYHQPLCSYEHEFK
jgi:hypothetical protein